ncbi:hypothetical protein F4678DRAFT_286720 [Xylaria arbuscula]|nr:hypothetical protein F4678DRAFT_286720 [Xylaria arbuscula]
MYMKLTLSSRRYLVRSEGRVRLILSIPRWVGFWLLDKVICMSQVVFVTYHLPLFILEYLWCNVGQNVGCNLLVPRYLYIPGACLIRETTSSVTQTAELIIEAVTRTVLEATSFHNILLLVVVTCLLRLHIDSKWFLLRACRITIVIVVAHLLSYNYLGTLNDKKRRHISSPPSA